MAVNTQTIRVDLNTGKEIPVAFAHQKDTNRQLTFTLYNKGQPYSPSGMTAKFAYRSPTVDGKYSVITGSEMPSGTIIANTVTVTLTEKMTSVAGMGLLTMILSASGNTLRPVNIKLRVQGSADGDDQVLFASDWPDGLYEYMDDWLAENEPTEIANLKSDLLELQNGGYVADAQRIGEVIDAWLDEHPEATTTVQDGAIGRQKLTTALNTELDGTIAGVFGLVSATEVDAIQKGQALGTVTISQPGFYDFRNASCNELIINTNGAIVNNLKVSHSITFKNGAQNNILKNIRLSTTETESIISEANVWANRFVLCNFIYTGTESAIWCKINIENKIMDTLLCIGCYWYNYAEIFSLYGSANISVIGGYADSIVSYVKCHAYTNANISFTGFDFESFTYIFDTSLDCIAVLNIDGYAAAGTIINATSSIAKINVNYTANRMTALALKSSATTTGNISFNLPDYNLCKYYFSGVVRSYEINRIIPPGAFIDYGKIHVHDITWSDTDFKVYTNGYQYESGTTYNGVVTLMIKNNSASSKRFVGTLNTLNILT